MKALPYPVMNQCPGQSNFVKETRIEDIVHMRYILQRTKFVVQNYIDIVAVLVGLWCIVCQWFVLTVLIMIANSWNTLSWNFSEIHNQIHTFCKPRLSLRTNFWTWFSRCTNITMLCWHNIKVRRLHFFRTRLPAFKTSLNLKTKREM